MHTFILRSYICGIQLQEQRYHISGIAVPVYWNSGAILAGIFIILIIFIFLLCHKHITIVKFTAYASSSNFLLCTFVPCSHLYFHYITSALVISIPRAENKIKTIKNPKPKQEKDFSLFCLLSIRIVIFICFSILFDIQKFERKASV